MGKAKVSLSVEMTLHPSGERYSRTATRDVEQTTRNIKDNDIYRDILDEFSKLTEGITRLIEEFERGTIGENGSRSKRSS